MATIYAIVTVGFEVPDDVLGPIDADHLARARKIVEENSPLGSGVAHCAWCAEANEPDTLVVLIEDDRHDEECPFAASAVHMTFFAVGAAMATVEAETRDDGTVVCGNCGSEEFRFEEGAYAPRSLVDNAGGVLKFSGVADEYGDGDDIPGVVCVGCNASVSNVGGGDEIEVEWQT